MLAHWIDNLNDTGRKVLFGVVALILVLAAVWASADKPANNTTSASNGGDASGQVDAVIVPEPTNAPESSPEPEPATGGLTMVTAPPVDAEQVRVLATKAAAFAATYQSFRFDEDPDAKVSAVRKQLSSNSQVAPEMAVPTGAALAAIRADRTTVSVTPTQVRVTLIATSTVAFVVDAQVAITRGADVDTQERSYAVTLHNNGRGWGVGSFSFDSDLAE